MIIGLSGYGGAGKDSVADVLVAERDFTKYAWADALRMAAAALNPIVAFDEYGAVRYNAALERVGYNQAKFDYPEVRQVLQRMGTEVGRDLIGENVWVDTTLRRIERDGLLDGNVVIPDTRFPNEAAAIDERSGLLVRVTRTGVQAANDHPSETSLDDYDFDSHLTNSGDLDDLRSTVLDWFDSLEILL